MMKGFEAQFGHWVLKLRWLILLLTVAVVMIAGSGGQFLKFTTNYRVFFSDDNPQLRSQNCHTRFVGLWRADEKIFSYRDWLAEGMQQFLRENFRVRGSNDEGQITDPEITRRSHSLYGSSAGGYGVLINCFSRPDAYYACAAIVPGVVSGFNPYSHYGIDGSFFRHDPDNTRSDAGPQAAARNKLPPRPPSPCVRSRVRARTPLHVPP